MAPKTSSPARRNLIAPSILSADFSRLAEEIDAVEKAGADWVHVDVMDGHFVDNLTIGPPVVASLKKVSEVPLDVHLMIEKPELSIDQYIKAGASILTIHVEATSDVAGVLKKIKGAGIKAGLTLRPQTAFSAVEKYLPLIDLLLVMTVSPGWGGQNFMEDQLDKVERAKAWSLKKNPELYIEVDGGINPLTAEKARRAGANVFVAGNAIFKSSGYAQAIQSLRGTAN